MINKKTDLREVVRHNGVSYLDASGESKDKLTELIDGITKAGLTEIIIGQASPDFNVIYPTTNHQTIIWDTNLPEDLVHKIGVIARGIFVR